MDIINTDLIKNSLNNFATFLYETPLSIVATSVAGVVACIFAPSLAAPLFALAGTALMTRVAVKVIERYNLELSIKINEQMDTIKSKYGSLYYAAFTVTILVSAMFPAMGIAMGICVGIYKGLVIELEVQNIKQDIREQESRSAFFSPGTWLTHF